MPKSSEPDLARLDLVDPAILSDPESPRILYPAKRPHIKARPRPRRLLGEQFEGPRKPPLDVPGEAVELALGTGLEEDLRRHGWSQPQPLPNLTPRDVGLFAQSPEMLANESARRIDVHEVVQHLVVCRAANFVRSQAPQRLRPDRDGRRRHAMVTVTAIILIPRRWGLNPSRVSSRLHKAQSGVQFPAAALIAASLHGGQLRWSASTSHGMRPDASPPARVHARRLSERGRRDRDARGRSRIATSPRRLRPPGTSTPSAGSSC